MCFAHYENVLLAMIFDERTQVREFAWRINKKGKAEECCGRPDDSSKVFST